MTHQCGILKHPDAIPRRLSRTFFPGCVWGAAATSLDAQTLNTNLIVNPGAEASAGWLEHDRRNDLGTASLNTSSTAQLAQISTRGRGESDNVMIGGFHHLRRELEGHPPRDWSIGITDALDDTTLELRDANGIAVAVNDDWPTAQDAEITATQIPPSDDRESAIVRTLGAGNYTAVVRGKGDTAGVALVELYALQ